MLRYWLELAPVAATRDPGILTPFPAGSSIEDFYTDERVKLIYRHNVCRLVNRVNSLTGVKYRDDPTIFSWDLINEPRQDLKSSVPRWKGGPQDLIDTPGEPTILKN